MRVANCTTAAQYFHLLRRQAALLLDRSAAAHRADAEEPAAPSAGRVDAARAGRRPLPHGDRRSRRPRRRAADIRRVLVCSGKVYVDLMASRAARRARPTSRSAASSSSTRCRCASCARRSSAIPTPSEIVWVQEEPENMGAWDFVRPHLLGSWRAAGRCAASRGRAAPARPKGSAARARASISRCSSSRRHGASAPRAKPVSRARARRRRGSTARRAACSRR